MAERTIQDLRQMQALPLDLKIRLTKARVRQWVSAWGEDGVYVSFSGGKDSTVLLHIVREEYPNVRAVFVDTGLEYPEIVQFVKTFDNVDIIKPKMNFKKVVEQYGYPFISKEVADTVKGAKKGQRSRIEKLAGTYKMGNGKISHFNKKKWAFLLEAPFEVDSYCCDVMKKQPTKAYETRTKRKPFLGQLAEESRKREGAWLHTGCNAFNIGRAQSNPMAFWRENDVLEYIKRYNVKICSVYGDVVYDEENSSLPDGQLTFLHNGAIAEARHAYKTTGATRTGCMFCGFGCYFSDDTRFCRMKETHPKQYEWIMKPKEQGGLGYKEVIDWINEHGNLNIKY